MIVFLIYHILLFGKDVEQMTQIKKNLQNNFNIHEGELEFIGAF